MPTSPRPGLSRISCNACHCADAPRPWQSVPPALRFLCLRRLPFFLRQKKGRKERRQNQGFGILFAAEVSSTSVSSYLADRDVQNLHLAFAWPLRRHPLAAHAGPHCPDAAGIHAASAVLCATFLVIVPYKSGTGGATGRRPQGSPLRTTRTLCTPCKKLCHCEPVRRDGVLPRPSLPVLIFLRGVGADDPVRPIPGHHPTQKRGGPAATS